jgi:hypothetical protein
MNLILVRVERVNAHNRQITFILYKYMYLSLPLVVVPVGAPTIAKSTAKATAKFFLESENEDACFIAKAKYEAAVYIRWI